MKQTNNTIMENKVQITDIVLHISIPTCPNTEDSDITRLTTVKSSVQYMFNIYSYT